MARKREAFFAENSRFRVLLVAWYVAHTNSNLGTKGFRCLWNITKHLVALLAEDLDFIHQILGTRALSTIYLFWSMSIHGLISGYFGQKCLAITICIKNMMLPLKSKCWRMRGFNNNWCRQGNHEYVIWRRIGRNLLLAILKYRSQTKMLQWYLNNLAKLYMIISSITLYMPTLL